MKNKIIFSENEYISIRTEIIERTKVKTYDYKVTLYLVFIRVPVRGSFYIEE